MSVIPAQANQIGTVYVCYACTGTGNSTIDAALTANPGVASDGILFAFINTSGFAITGGVFSVSNASPNDSFTLPTIAAGATFILMPGITSDSGTHPSGGLFFNTGSAQDTSDGVGGLTDNSIFKFTGTDNSLAVTSTTFGTSTGTPGTFTPGDPGLDLPYRSPVSAGSSISFIGDGPSGDGGCNNCYYGEVATLNTVSGVPEPASPTLLILGLGTVCWMGRRRTMR
jgi:phage tail protein X